MFQHILSTRHVRQWFPKIWSILIFMWNQVSREKKNMENIWWTGLLYCRASEAVDGDFSLHFVRETNPTPSTHETEINRLGCTLFRQNIRTAFKILRYAMKLCLRYTRKWTQTTTNTYLFYNRMEAKNSLHWLFKESKTFYVYFFIFIMKANSIWRRLQFVFHHIREDSWLFYTTRNIFLYSTVYSICFILQ